MLYLIDIKYGNSCDFFNTVNSKFCIIADLLLPV